MPHGSPDDGGDRRLTGTHAAQQKGPWYLLLLVLTGPSSVLREVFNAANKPVGMARFTQPCGYARYLLLSSQSYLRAQG